MTSAVYPVPTTSAGAIYVLLAVLTVGLPIYVLVFRPIRDERTWGLAEIVAIAVLFILALPLAAQVLGVGHEFNLLELSVAAIAQNAMLAGLSAYVVLYRYRLPARSLGLHAPGGRRLLAVGGAAAAAAVLLATAGERVAIYVIGLVTGPQQAALMAAKEHLEDPLLPVLGTLAGALPVTWLLVLLCVIVPIGEEIFFRGFVYGGLRARWGAPLAVFVSAAFFAAVHLQLVHAFPIFLLGVVFAMVYHKTGSLAPAIVAHGVNNLIAVLSRWQGWGI